MSENRILTCVYCGQEYPQETPAWGNEVLTEHIKICEKHPMRKLELDKKALLGVLQELVGANNKKELKEMEDQLQALITLGVSTDVVKTCHKAIGILLKTMD